VSLVQSRLVASLRDDTDDPDTYLQRLQERVAYAGHPYLNRAEGTAGQRCRLTPQGLAKLHQKLLETSRLLLVIVGDSRCESTESAHHHGLRKLPRGSYKLKRCRSLLSRNRRLRITPRTLRQITFREYLARRR